MSTPSCPSCGSPLPLPAAYCDQCGSASHTQVIGETSSDDTDGLSASYQNDRGRLQRVLGDQYELGELLGRGGYAEVYAVRDRKLRRDLAIKVLRPDLIVTPALLARFRREALSVAALQHPAIVPVYDVGEKEGICYIVMPLIRGESLKAVLKRQHRLPIDEVQRIVTAAAGALAVAHEAGVVHRDIKPENVMLEDRDRQVRLMDFGIAKAVDSSEKELTGTGVVVGTPQYMSPEQASGEPTIDPRSDQYSLAILAYQMLTGRAPFDGETARAIIAKQLLEQPPQLDSLVDNVPPHIVAALHRAMQKQPARRFERITDFAAALADTGYRNPESLTLPVAAAAPPSEARSRRWLPWVVTAVAASGLVAVAMSQWRAPVQAAIPAPPDTVTIAVRDDGPVTPISAPSPPPPPPPPAAVGPTRTDTVIITQPVPQPPPVTADTTPVTPPAPPPSCRVLVDQKDWTRALAQCVEEGQAGSPIASRRAAEILSTGAGAVPRDEATAAQLYEQAARGGDPEAQFVVAERMAATDPTLATNYYRRAAERNHIPAFARIAERLDRGLGTAVDVVGAAGWYQRAAAAGDVVSQRRLAEFYVEGRGLRRDETAAAEWFRKAADPGQGNDHEAQFRLSQMYFNGRGVTRSEEEGLRWLRLAAAGGHEAARRELDRRG